MRPDTTQGLEALYRLHRAELLRFLIARTGDPEEAEEILQEVWIKLKRGGISPVSNGRAYLFKMSQNLVVDRLREKQRRMRRERIWMDDLVGSGSKEHPTDRTPNAEEALLDREEAARLQAALETLPDGARRVFDLHKIEGLSHAEVAMRLGISRSGVEKHMAVAMKYLRRALLD
ncbi:MAG: sigma-70 family RNA polymerase sigma factor [Novosphingobium aromaticivorans]|nr:sigma-70 family RNA polymerase sigma factor [Novosphingobium aromaticivorans]